MKAADPEVMISHRSRQPMRTGSTRPPAAWWIAALVVFSYTSALAPSVAEWSSDQPIAVPGMSLAPWITSALAILALFTKRQPASVSAAGMTAVLTLVAIASVSMLWTLNIVVSARELISLVATALTAYVLATRLTTRQFLTATSAALLVVAILSLAAGWLAPAAQNPTAEGLRGVLQAKNMLGRFTATGLLVELCLLLSGWRTPFRAIWRAAVFGGTLALSLSASSLIVAATMGALSVLVWWGYRSQRSAAALIGVLVWIPVASLILVSGTATDWLLSTTGRDATLSNRTLVWEASLQELGRTAVFGFGWESFWQTPGAGRERVWANAGGAIAHAHNGFIDVALGIGVLGLISAGAIAVVSLVNARRRSRLERSHASAIWLLPCLPIAFSITESNFVHGFNVFTLMLFVSAIVGPIRCTTTSGRRTRKKAGT
ncbi:O-antigen ligase family protein [Microbacterium sp. NPDC077184]|uniref:O-antigen ligase family protein n=1 Tax=Microbacterium sp. NPDC077184 TaxID=3154764 RepID=UPI00343760DE